MTPDVAFDGTNYLVSWMDRRNGVWNIYGARVSPQGAVLDKNGIPISTAPDFQIYPALAFGQATRSPCGRTSATALTTTSTVRA